MIGIRSLRIYAVMVHFFCTTSLMWTSMDNITVSYDDQAEREKQMENYRYAVAFAVACLGLQGIFLSISLNRVTLASVIHLFLDCAGSFFSLWIALDGLSWATYGVTATICIYTPTLVTVIRSILKMVRDVKANSKRPQYINADFLTRVRLWCSCY
eukprot:CAMPEP_0114413540 /NCGR_PEP_ID=MMETSP0103-20121206/911_1 /TAXON_ID=37642 ORGANISM="Paraphysomonas imperforata, Strain PA2" /NCGR_SAMPLE_ID=MMETSP0103 /ASSEMBLY_ACC=CAM_ASM_000201 /LENGTH=155 /DNA_ID=CAMNT_0001581625 /DNA_START=83 /DNA_END=550 /DNA_ORIENTATION=+